MQEFLVFSNLIIYIKNGLHSDWNTVPKKKHSAKTKYFENGKTKHIFKWIGKLFTSHVFRACHEYSASVQFFHVYYK